MNSRPIAPLWIAVAVCLATASSVRADWHAEGVRVATGEGAQSGAVLASDGAGGAFIAWQDNRSGANAIFAQHLTGNGTPASGWPVAGIPLAGSGQVDPVIVSDGRGGAFVAATNGGSIGLWHLPNGVPLETLAPLARPGPVSSARPSDTEKTSPTVLPVLLPDETGGVFLAWEDGGRLSEYVDVEHFTADGQVAPPWPATVSLGYGHAPTMCSDAAGGIFVATPGIVVQHVAVRSNSVVETWPSWVSATPLPHGIQNAPGVVPDGEGGALVFWQDSRQAGREQVFAQRLTGSGTLAAGWPADGLPICGYATDAGLTRSSASFRTQRYSLVAADGAGGAFVAWRDLRSDGGDVYLQHVLPDGSPAAGWTANGVPVCRASGVQTAPSIAPDGSGGAFVSWQDQRSATTQVFLQHILAMGTADPTWPSDGAPACNDPAARFLPRLIASSTEGPLLAWQDSRLLQSAIYATRLRADGSLSPVGPCYVGVSLTTATADSGTIHIVWQLSHADTTTATLYCRQVDGPWTPITRRSPDASGRIDYADREGLAGCRYEYALGLATCGGPEQMLGVLWIDVPEGHGFPSLLAEPTVTMGDGGPLRLTWQLPGAEGLTAIVSRRDSCTQWTNVDTLTLGESSEIVYEEHALFEGHSADYRLQIHACGRDNLLTESWVTVPTGHGFTPTEAMLSRAVADAAGVHLAWQMQSGPPSRAKIYRRTTSSWWSQVREYPMVAGETIEFVDLAVRPATRYEYCLGLSSCGAEPIFGNALVNTPAAIHTPVALALQGARPNPSRSGFTVSFALASSEPAQLDVFDAGGRRVTSTAVGDLGPGDHALTLNSAKLESGVYVIRLTQAGHTLRTRATFIR